MISKCHKIFSIPGFYLLFVLIIATFFIGTHPVFSQTSLSIEELIELAEKTKWQNTERAISLLANDMENRAAGSPGQADLALAISKIYNDKRDCDSIAFWYQVAEEIYLRLDDQRALAEVSYQKGYEALCRGNYEEALEFVLEGLKVMEETGDQAGMALGHLRMARIFHFTFKLGQSAESGIEAAVRFENLKDYPNAWDSYSFAGHGYRMENDSIQAEYCFSKGLEMAEQSGLPKVVGLAYNDLAAFHMEFNQYDSAIIYFEKALQNSDPEDQRQQMVIKNGLGQVYLATGRYQECIDLLTESLKTVYKTDEVFFLTELPEYIAQSYAALGQFDSAYKYMEMNWRYSDSLFTANQDQALEEMKSKYESDKKDALIERQKNERKYIYALLLSALVVVISIYRRYILKKRTNQILDQRNKEKDYLLREIHHRVKNNLQILSSLLNLQADYIQDENALNALKEGRNRVQSMSFIHQQLYSDEHITAVDMKEYVGMLCEHLSDSFSLSQRMIEISHQVDVPFFEVETAIPIGLIINELITNSIKYAFQGRRQGQISVRMWIGPEQKLLLKVTDDGPGQPAGKSGSSSSFGTDLIEVLSQKLKGRISIDTSKGYSTTIEFSRFKVAGERYTDDQADIKTSLEHVKNTE